MSGSGYGGSYVMCEELVCVDSFILDSSIWAVVIRRIMVFY